MRAESELFRDIVEHSPDVLILMDGDGRFEYFSPATERVFGRDPISRIGQHFSVLGESFTAAAAPLFEAMRRGECDAGRIDGFIRRGDGEERWVERNARAIRAADGTLRSVLMVTRDAHERFLATQRQRVRDEQLRFLTDRVHEMFWTTDATGRITYSSPGTLALLGWTPEERVGKDFRDTGHSEALLTAGRDLFARATRGEVDEATFEGEMRRKDGSLVWTETTARVERNVEGRIVGIFHVTRDITARREAERALREREEHLRFIMDNTRDVVWTIDRSGVITYVSPSIERVFGRRPSERVGTHVSQTFLASSFVSGALELLTKAQRGEIDDVSFEAQQERLDGTALWVDIAGRVLRDASGAMTSAVMVTRDIDERKQIELLLERQRVRLQQRSQELADALRDLESFASMVSHDLQGPLRRIETLATTHTEAPDVVLTRIRAAARQGNAIVDGLLDLARFGSRPVQNEDVDLSRHASEVLAELRDTHPHRSVATEVQPSLVARGDSRLLHVLLRNLLTNAWKFTVSTPAARIRVGAESAPAGAVYFVEDNGVGFDQSHVGAMFRPFVRVNEGGEPGSGIGLATVERIAHRHGGRVWATGVPGQGARFSFTLPAISGAPESPDDPASTAHR